MSISGPFPIPPPPPARRALGRLGASLVLACLLLPRLPRATAAAPGLPSASAPVLVAAAANLQPVLAELLALFAQTHPTPLQVVMGSSSNLVRQIQQGLPAQLFLSADEDFAWRLADAGLTLDRGQVYATGRLVLVVPAGSPLPLDARLEGLKAVLPQLQKFAIANPALAPYGRAAVQVLQQQGLWTALQPKLVMGDNIAQTTQFVATGAADAGITALSLMLAPEVAARVRHVVVPASLHAPLRQRMVLLKNAGPTARAFHAFLQSPAARAVLVRYGYA